MSQKEVVGSCWNIKEVDFKGKNLYSVLIDQDGSQIQIGFGESKPSFSVGDLVKLSATQSKNDRWNLTKGTTPKVKPGAGTQPERTQSSGGGGRSGGGNYGGYNGPHRQYLIAYQHAQKVAVDLTSAALVNGALVLPAAKAKKHEALVDYFTEITNGVFTQIVVFEENLKAGVPAKEALTSEVKPASENLDEDFPDEEVKEEPKASEESWEDDDDWN